MTIIITTIFFGDGGSVHFGYNNSGYTYLGGGIHFDTDYNGNITRAYAKIQVNYDNGAWQYFIVTL